MIIVRGQRVALDDRPAAFNVGVQLSYGGAGDLGVCCIGLDAGGRLSDDRYLVHEGRRSSPEGAVRVIGPDQGDGETFQVDLGRLPAAVTKLVFVACLFGPGALNQLSHGHIRLLAEGAEELRFFFSGQDFAQEKAVMLAELSERGGSWRFYANGQGFVGGLRAVFKHFGAEALYEAYALSASPVGLNAEDARRLLESICGQGRGGAPMNFHDSGDDSADDDGYDDGYGDDLGDDLGDGLGDDDGNRHDDDFGRQDGVGRPAKPKTLH